jgi:hypothetical protein
MPDLCQWKKAEALLGLHGLSLVCAVHNTNATVDKSLVSWQLDRKEAGQLPWIG